MDAQSLLLPQHFCQLVSDMNASNAYTPSEEYTCAQWFESKFEGKIAEQNNLCLGKVTLTVLCLVNIWCIVAHYFWSLSYAYSKGTLKVVPTTYAIIEFLSEIH